MTTTTVNDTFTDTAATLLQSHTGETGATWTKHGSYSSGSAQISANGTRLAITATNCAYYASGVPSSADYTINAYGHVILADNGEMTIAGRMSTGADTFYWARLQNSTLSLFKRVAGSFTQLGSNVTYHTTTGQDLKLTLDMSGTTIRLLVDDVEQINQTDSAISAVGRAGFRTTTTASDAAGIPVDRFEVTEAGATYTLSGSGSIVLSGSDTGLTFTGTTFTLSGSGAIVLSGSGAGIAVTNPVYTLSGSGNIVLSGSGAGLEASAPASSDGASIFLLFQLGGSVAPTSSAGETVAGNFGRDYAAPNFGRDLGGANFGRDLGGTNFGRSYPDLNFGRDFPSQDP